jgi:L-fucose isomerase-like protein
MTSGTKNSELGVLMIGRKRPGFDQQWNEIIKGRSLESLKSLGYSAVGAEAPVVDDQTIRAALGHIRDRGCRALVVLQPSLGAGQLAFTVMQEWSGPVILWATPERPTGEKVSSCSLVGQHLWCASMRQSNHPFELVYGDPDSTETRQSLRDAIAMSTAVMKLKHAKVGRVGAQAPGFIPMASDPFTLRQKLGAQLHDLSLIQFVDRVRAIEQGAVDQDLQKARELKLPLNGVSGDDLAIQSRTYLAMKQLIEEEQLDALAMQEWPELPNVLGQWPYLAMSRLQDDGFPLSMEGDVDAAITLLLAYQSGTGKGFITDWLEHDAQTITFWHAGIAPIEMLTKPSLGQHFNIAKPMVVDGNLRDSGPMTMARIWRCDDRYHATALQAQAVASPRQLTGNIVTLKLSEPSVHERLDTLLHAGMPHHPVLFAGHHAERFFRLARMLKINWIESKR